MQFPIYTFILNMICFIDDYFLQSITAVLIDWFFPKMNMLKGLIKMKKHFQVTLFFLAWGVLCSTVGIFFSQELLERHPGLDLRCMTRSDKLCDCCSERYATRSFKFQQLTYRSDTLDIMEGEPTTTKVL